MGKEGKLYLAPIDNPARVLDVGTGTGIWALDFGEYVVTNPLLLNSVVYSKITLTEAHIQNLM
jgi:ubiquinone/menaquinone biosynthesis C-methylase UbiE